MKIHELLASPTAWHQGSLAAKANGQACRVNDRDAVCWCLLGAVGRCYAGVEDGLGYYSVAGRIAHAVFGGSDTSDSISAWNDAPGRTHAEVLALVKELDV